MPNPLRKLDNNELWKQNDFLNITKYKGKLDALEKQIKEKNTTHIEDKEAKKALHNLIKEAYTILIDRLWYKINSFKTWLEIQVLNNEIITKRLLRELQNEILIAHNAKELKEKSIETQKMNDAHPQKTKENLWKNTQIIQMDERSLMEKVKENRYVAVKRVERYINNTTWPLKPIISWVSNKAK